MESNDLDIDLNSSFEVNATSNAIVPSKIETNDLVKYYGNGSQFHFRVLDKDNNPVSGLNVVLKLNGKEYVKSTDKNGSGYLVVNKILLEIYYFNILQ